MFSKGVYNIILDYCHSPRVFHDEYYVKTTRIKGNIDTFMVFHNMKVGYRVEKRKWYITTK